MDIKYCLVDSYYKHIKNNRVKDSIWSSKSKNITVAKEEKFALGIMIKSDEEFNCSLDLNNNVCYKGLINNIRLDIKTKEDIKDNFKLSFIDYVKDDNGDFIGDVILREPFHFIKEKETRMIWVEGKIPKDFKEKSLDLKIKFYFQKGYTKEEEMESLNIKVDLLDITLKPLKDYEFYLDLWQHPSNWARMYKVPLWSDDHFKIIENYLKELVTLGQKTICCIVSDFPWGGQSCYKVFENSSNLFEINMISLKKDKKGKFLFDFSNLDRYIEICMKLGIEKEIDLFGISGLWDAKGFGNPIKDYRDPIRVRYFDESMDNFRYIDSKKELGEYIKALFNHLIEKGWWDKVRVMSDEPSDSEFVNTYVEFLDSLIENHKVTYKTALHSEECFENGKEKFKDISLSLPLLLKYRNEIQKTKNDLNYKKGALTYYVCCMPDRINNFLCSPLIESRLIPWITYYFNLDGFLRWDYAIWPKDPLEEMSYKYPHWKAGDMLFVYPGRDMKPLRSLRWENLRFGIQDYQLFKMLEERGISKETIYKEIIEKNLGKKEDMKYINSFAVSMPECAEIFSRKI
ncbi:DUF4091 domain-containing protein [Clostridium oceanicum]|uniref:DUF4091 domain-containing protein n=1 Tax=Clostridium oceanicum TaxID=1543 RepID=A0ABN1JIC9_9CLOT